ncbi:MAG: hypothetical protein IPP00_12265 [Actinomycetales bacterium]|uniref:Uncharacterized protein n=1 Tax=Candidatus Phosphoribacter hodrii TaxID=2953743 RepID=A0A9D7T8S0_9MICO|nr:hypothetical protein [Candidatus Phosphoribacter hodrii]
MNPMRALAIRLGAQPWLPRLAPVVLGLDKALFAATRGRAGVLSMSGCRGSAHRRRPHRARQECRCSPSRTNDGWLVAGSNWGGPAHPLGSPT